MTRSDLPRVAALPPEKQRAAIDAVWRAYCKAEGWPRKDPTDECPLAWVATFAEVLEAALEATGPDPYAGSCGWTGRPS